MTIYGMENINDMCWSDLNDDSVQNRFICKYDSVHIVTPF